MDDVANVSAGRPELRQVRADVVVRLGLTGSADWTLAAPVASATAIETRENRVPVKRLACPSMCPFLPVCRLIVMAGPWRATGQLRPGVYQIGEV
jgi:hypothetical protein